MEILLAEVYLKGMGILCYLLLCTVLVKRFICQSKEPRSIEYLNMDLVVIVMLRYILTHAPR